MLVSSAKKNPTSFEFVFPFFFSKMEFRVKPVFGVFFDAVEMIGRRFIIPSLWVLMGGLNQLKSLLFFLGLEGVK